MPSNIHNVHLLDDSKKDSLFPNISNTYKYIYDVSFCCHFTIDVFASLAKNHAGVAENLVWICLFVYCSVSSEPQQNVLEQCQVFLSPYHLLLPCQSDVCTCDLEVSYFQFWAARYNDEVYWSIPFCVCDSVWHAHDCVVYVVGCTDTLEMNRNEMDK